MTIDDAEIKQNEFAEKIDELRAYPARGSKQIYLKESVSKNTKNFYDGWEKKQTKFNDFLSQIKEEQKNIDMSLFKEVFDNDRPDLTKCYKLYTI